MDPNTVTILARAAPTLRARLVLAQIVQRHDVLVAHTNPIAGYLSLVGRPAGVS